MNKIILEWQTLSDTLIFTVVVTVIASIIAQIIISRQKYVCPKCGAVISPKWYHFSASLHRGSDRIVKCPHCGRKGFCRKSD